MKTTKRKNRENGAPLRATLLVSLVLALIAWASWFAPTGHTSSEPAAPVAATKAGSSSRSAHLNARSQSTSSPSSRMIPDATNVWTTNGPEGGSIQALAIDPRNPAILYAATYADGVFKTTNSGASWSAVNTELRYITKLAINPGNTQTLYAIVSGGVFKSTDGGVSWSPANSGLPSGYGMIALVVDPSQADTLYAGSYPGAFKSIDGGASWHPSSGGLSNGPGNVAVRALAVDPGNSNTVYAGLDENGPSIGGLYKSTDAGNSWTFTGPDRRTVNEIAIDPSNANILYASTYSGLIKSSNGGASWNQSNAGLPTNGVYPPVTLMIDQSNSNILYAGFYEYISPGSPSTGGTVFKSLDGGASWNRFDDGLTGGLTTLAMNPENPNTVYAGTSTGLFKSTNAATNWRAINTGVNAIHVSALAVATSDARVVYAGTSQGVFKSSNGGESWVNTGVTGIPVNALAVAPSNPNIIFAGIDYGGYGGGLFKSSDSGATWSFNVLSGLGVAAIAIDPGNANTIYASAYYSTEFDYSSSVLKSTDGGETWNGVISVYGPLAIDSTRPNTIYLAGWGQIYKSIDGGANWNFFNDGLPATYVNALAIDPTESNTIYAGTGWDSGVKDTNTGVFKSTDGGVTWKGIGPANAVSALAIDSSNPNTIYTGTYAGGVLKSTDAGASWSPFNDGLTNFNINALAIDASGNFLRAGTGAGVFDIQLSPPLPPSQIDDAAFFITQQYLDFLRRSPEAGPDGIYGTADDPLKYYLDLINNYLNTPPCTPSNAECIKVIRGIESANFFRSPEFQRKGNYVMFLTMVSIGQRPVTPSELAIKNDPALNDRPHYAEFMADLQSISTPNDDPALTEAKKAALADAWMLRPQIQALYPAAPTMTNAQFVQTLLNTAGVTISNQDQLVNDLETNQKTRAQVLRIIAESPEVNAKFYKQAFVTMEYFGYLRRDPEDCHNPQNWTGNDPNQCGFIFHNNRFNLGFDPADVENVIVRGFIESPEYRQRFGP